MANEQPSTAKWNILGTNDAYFDSLVGSGTAWTAYTPSFANTTLGNGAVVGAYQKFGKTVLFRAKFTLGSTSAVASSPTVTLPVTSVATFGAGTNIGQAVYEDAGNNYYPGTIKWTSTTVATLFTFNASATYATEVNVTSAIPFTFGTADIIYATGAYEAA